MPPPSLRPPPPPPIGDPLWSAVLGGVAGALGGFVMLLAAQFVAFMMHERVDFVRASERFAVSLLHGRTFPGVAFVLPVVAGAAVGVVLGYLSRRLLRVLPRLLFFCLLLPILLLFVLAVVAGRGAPAASGSVPLSPLVAGALVYATFLAVVSPLRSR